MRGYFTKEEMAILQIQREPIFANIEQRKCLKKSLIYKIVFGIIVILTVISAFFIYSCLDLSIQAISCEEDPNIWTFIVKLYSVGSAPALFFLCVIALIGNVLLLCKRQNGFWFMLLLSIPIILPTVLRDYCELLSTTVCIFFIMLMFYIILRIPNKKKSYWCNIKQGSLCLRNICIIVWGAFVVCLFATPFILSKQAGCITNVITNGADIFNAKYGVEKYNYCNRIAKKMVKKQEFITSDKEVKEWFEMSIGSLRNYYSYNDYIYLDYADFLESIGEYEQAYKIYKKANYLFRTDETLTKYKAFLNMHSEFNNP